MSMAPTEYELFVKELYQKMIEKQNHKNIEVKHNIKLTGKSKATHQIDVYWSTNIANVEQHYCVECKHWKHEVKKSDIASFISVLKDIGNASGVYVTTKGYQNGAKLLAEQNNIKLITAKKIIKRYTSYLRVGMPSYDNVQVEFEDLDNEKTTLINSYKQPIREEVQLFNSEGVTQGSLTDMINHLNYEKDGFVIEDMKKYYIKIQGDLTRLNNICFYYKNNYINELTLKGYGEVAEAVANCILSGESHYFSL
jgi:ribosomal protein S24E